MKNSAELEKDAVLITAKQMAAASRTAPKTRGIDNIEIFAIDEDSTKKKVIEKMRDISKKEKRPGFDRDANSIESNIGSRTFNTDGIFKTCTTTAQRGIDR